MNELKVSQLSLFQILLRIICIICTKEMWICVVCTIMLQLLSPNLIRFLVGVQSDTLLNYLVMVNLMCAAFS